MKWTRMLITLATVVSFGAYAGEVTQTDSKPITVSYTVGADEHYIVRWAGTIDIEHHEDGHPSEPLKGWFTDTRQCHWAISSRITRRVFLLNRNGQEYVQEELTTPLTQNFANKGSDFVVTQLRPENCGDAEGRFQSDVADSKKHMHDVFQQVVTSDFAVVSSTMKGWPKVKNVDPK